MSTLPSESEPIAWTAIGEYEPVFCSDGEQAGTVAEVLGTEDGGIFHGLAVKHHVMENAIEVPASAVGEITVERIVLNISKDAFEQLPPFEERAFRIGIKGLFRHHPGWVKDKR